MSKVWRFAGAAAATMSGVPSIAWPRTMELWLRISSKWLVAGWRLSTKSMDIYEVKTFAPRLRRWLQIGRLKQHVLSSIRMRSTWEKVWTQAWGCREHPSRWEEVFLPCQEDYFVCRPQVLSQSPGCNRTWPFRETQGPNGFEKRRARATPKKAKGQSLWKTCSHRLGQVKIVFSFFLIILVIITFIIF